MNYVNNHVLSYRYSTPFPVCTILVGPILGGENDSDGLSLSTQTEIIERGGQDSALNWKKQPGIYEGTLWGNDAGVCLRLVGKSSFESRFKDSFHVMAQITGRMSEAVWKELCKEFKRILPSMWRSVQTPGETSYGLDTAASLIKCVTIDESNLPVVSEADFEGGRAFVQKCIDTYFSTPTKKDCTERRIRNAVHLLIASDDQSNGAIGLALSVAAIEALLGEKGGEISHRIADHIAALLEPKLARRQDCVKFFKDLYNKRSRVLHGEEIEDVG